MKKWIWIFFILSTFIVIYLNLSINYNHINELIRINKIENLEKKREHRRKTTVKCPIDGLLTARDCYYNSNFRCKWDTFTQRCNRI